MKINTGEIASVIKQEIAQYEAELEVSEVGKVLEVGDGIARVYGLTGARAGEMLEFEAEGGKMVMGQVFNLEEDSVGAVIFGDYLAVTEGATVRATGDLLSVPVGEGLLGRVVNSLGEPIDGKGPIESSERRKMDIIAPGIAERQPVTQFPHGGAQRLHELLGRHVRLQHEVHQAGGVRLGHGHEDHRRLGP